MTVLTTIIIVLVVLLLLWMLVRWLSQTNTTLNGVTRAGAGRGGQGAAPMPRKRYKLKGNTNTSNYTFSIWYYVTQWNPVKAGRVPLISSDHGFSIAMAGESNDLKIQIPETAIGNKKPGDKVSCSVYNVPLQRWTNVIVSVYGRTVDVYIDGKLVKTCLLEHPGMGPGRSGCVSPYIDGEMGPNAINGYTANGQYWDSATSPQQAYNIYKNGFSGSMANIFDKYRLKVAFLEDNREKIALEI